MTHRQFLLGGQDNMISLDPHANKKWVYLDGFLHLKANPNLVMGINSMEVRQDLFKMFTLERL